MHDHRIGRLLLFGGTGDLSMRYLLPALAVLLAAGELPEGFGVVGAARGHLSDEDFRDRVADALRRHAGAVPAPHRDALVRATRYRRVDVDDAGSVGRAVAEALSDRPDAPLAAYLALPPDRYAPTVRALCAARFPSGSRIVVEKPFGADLGDAVTLNALLARAGGGDERATYRVDHFLGLASVQNLLGMRAANRVLDPVWNSTHVEQVEIVWEETLGLEGRATYYDRAGQLRDMVQNHLLQVMCLLAMEPPVGLGDPGPGERKIDLLRTVRPPAAADMGRLTRRARYGAGRLGDREVPSYVDEPGVDPARGTETFAEVTFDIDNARWSGTPFVVRTGKALRRPRQEVAVRFRPAAGHPPSDRATVPNELHVALAEPGAVTLHLNGAAAGTPPRPARLTLAGEPPESTLPPYSRVLIDVLDGGTEFSVRGDEAEQAWRIVTPVLQAWAAGHVPMQEYAAGSDGPSR